VKLKLLYLITEDWFFCSHFLERAVSARAAGFEVVVVTRVKAHGDLIRAAGLRLVPINIKRRSLNLLDEVRTLFTILHVFRNERPDIVHQIALKPILYGSFVAKLIGLKAIVNAPVGMGYVFSSEDTRARFLRPLIRFGLRILLNPNGSRVVFENPDDLEALVSSRTVRSDAAILIRGAGVDIEKFYPVPEPCGAPKVVLLARMLRDKGVEEFVDAARLLRADGCKAQFWLVGGPDPGNPASIDEEQLVTWHKEEVIQWYGHRTDVADLIATSHIVCLPSYREGLPKVLLEALASGRPVVTTNVTGCKEVVTDGINGLLVPARDVPSLVVALRRLIDNPTLRIRFGRAGRERAVSEFSSGLIVSSTLNLYQMMVSGLNKKYEE
jgi:glycosyltransferase involved in cell wall biosynthesis